MSEDATYKYHVSKKKKNKNEKEAEEKIYTKNIVYKEVID